MFLEGVGAVAELKLGAGSRLDAVLVHCKILDEARAQRWAEMAAREGLSLENVLVRENAMNRRQLLQALENFYFCPAVDVATVVFDARLVGLLPARLAKRHQAMAVGVQGETVVVAFGNPDDEESVAAVTQALQRPMRAMVALPGDLRERIDSFYGEVAEPLTDSPGAPAGTPAGATAAGIPVPSYAPVPAAGPAATTAAAAVRPEPVSMNPSRPANRADWTVAEVQRFEIEERLLVLGSSAIAIVDEIMHSACTTDATDVHVEPSQHALTVRFRIDGILHRVATLPETLTPAVTSRFKVVAQMDIAERRVPQDGRFSMQMGELLVDLRVSSLPSQFGEKIVVRLLKKDMTLLNLDNVKMPPEVRALHQDMIHSPAGFFLVTGPTGSGKTTTLYATLAAIDRESQNVVTLEDPIEYSLKGITQVQINEAAGLTFERCLQSILRQDPDTVLVGEIRSSDTVEIACRAALTGHKVFSTLHTTDATQAVARLLDMGCVPYLITSTLRGVLAQRLVRVICKSCKEAYAPTPGEIAILGTAVAQLHRGRGCRECGHTGYRGRVAIFEYFRMDEKYHRLVLERSSSFAIRNAARRDGMITMGEYGKRAVLAGVTTVAEIERCVLSEDGHEQLCKGCERIVSIEYAVCPYCTTVLRENCPTCTKPVESNWEVCAHCGNEIAREWRQKHCKQCDAPNESGWKACPYCGCEA